MESPVQYFPEHFCGTPSTVRQSSNRTQGQTSHEEVPQEVSPGLDEDYIHSHVNGVDMIQEQPSHAEFPEAERQGLDEDDIHSHVNGPLARYAKLRVRMRRECRERFPRHHR